MGDSGSLTLGFALGTISLLSVTRIAGLTTIIVPLVIAGIPIIDTFSAIVRRARAHVRVDQADRGHIHHRLIAAGYDQRQAVLVVYVWTALLCLGSLVMRGLFCSIASCWAFRRSAVRCCAASCSGEPSSRISPTRFATSLAVSLPEPMPAKRLSVLG